jgi:hypothetical protein
MKKAKIIIFLQVAFLVMTIAFSTGIAFNNGPGQGISLSVADKAVNLALRNANLEIADPASGIFQEQLSKAHAIAGIWQEIKNGNIPDNAKELAGIPGAYLVSFTVKVNGQDQQAMVVIAQEEIPSLQGQRDSALSFGDINVYIPPASLFTDTDAAKASSAGAVNIPVEFPILEIPHGYYDAEIPARIIKGENPGQILFNSRIIGSNLYMVPVKPLPDGTSHLVMGPENHDSELALLALGLQKDDELSARYGVLIARPTTELLESVLAQREAFSGVPAKASSAGVVTFVGKHIITYSNEEELIARFMADTNFAAANPAFMKAISSLEDVHLDGLKDAVSDLAAGPTADNNWIGPIEEVSEGIYTLSMLVQANIADERGLSLMPLLIKANSESMDGANVNLKVHPIISIQPVDDRVAEELAVIKSSTPPKASSAGLAQEVTDTLTQLQANPTMRTLERAQQILQAAYAKYTASPEPGARESVDVTLQALKSISIHQRAQESILARTQDVSSRPASQTQPVLAVYHDTGSMPSTLKADAIRSLGTQHFRVETLDINTIPNDLDPENSIIITANLDGMQAALKQAGKEKTKILPISKLQDDQFVPFVHLTQQAKDILLLSIPGLVSDNIIPTITTRIGNTYTVLTGGRFVDIDAYISNPAAYIIELAPAVAPVYEPGQLETLYNMIIQAAQAA